MRQCMAGILGRKLGSTQIFDPESGACSHVTVIKAGPCRVTQVKTREVNGYSALQLGLEEVSRPKLKRVNRPPRGTSSAPGFRPCGC